MLSPAHKQDTITKTLREWISSGRYAPGEKLPTNQELAAYFDVNRQTVASGIRPLVAEGLLDKAPRRGTTVLSRPSRPVSNAVGLVSQSRGDVYADMVRDVDLMLHKHDLFPVVVDNNLAYNLEEIEQFLSRMLKDQQPAGFLMEGSNKLPYRFIKENPNHFSNTVILFYYEYSEPIPFCRSVMFDLDAMGRMVVDYFADRGAKNLLFPAMYEGEYLGDWNSLQSTTMRSISDQAKKRGVRFDEEIFWKFFLEQDHKTLLHDVFRSKNPPDAVFGWTDFHLCGVVMPFLQEIGIDYGNLLTLGCYNTPYSRKYGFSSVDYRVREIMQKAVDILTGVSDEKKVLVKPMIVEHAIALKNGKQQKKENFK